MFITKKCPMCEKIVAIKMSDEDCKKYLDNDNGLIQDRLPNMGIVEREFLISGYCYSCQSLLFGNIHKPNREVWVDV